MTVDETRLNAALAEFPRVDVAHTPTPLDAADNLGNRLGLSLFIKRDDCTGFGFGGNKVRQLEYYFGAALAEKSDTVLITGAVQSNYARTTAAMAGETAGAAARSGSIFHLWWHPHNFGRDTNANLDFLSRLLAHYGELNDRFGMRSATMAEAAA